MACPYLKIENQYRDEYYCKIDQMDIDYNQYRDYCYSNCDRCPIYDHEYTRREREGLPRLKGKYDY